MVSVRTVVEMPDLRLVVRAGAELLDREVTRIYSTELPDPARFLSGGELVLTGLLWLRSGEDVPPFVAALAVPAELLVTVQPPDRPGVVGVLDDQVYALLPADDRSDADLADAPVPDPPGGGADRRGPQRLPPAGGRLPGAPGGGLSQRT